MKELIALLILVGHCSGIVPDTREPITSQSDDVEYVTVICDENGDVIAYVDNGEYDYTDGVLVWTCDPQDMPDGCMSPIIRRVRVE